MRSEKIHRTLQPLGVQADLRQVRCFNFTSFVLDLLQWVTLGSDRIRLLANTPLALRERFEQK